MYHPRDVNWVFKWTRLRRNESATNRPQPSSPTRRPEVQRRQAKFSTSKQSSKEWEDDFRYIQRGDEVIDIQNNEAEKFLRDLNRNQIMVDERLRNLREQGPQQRQRQQPQQQRQFSLINVSSSLKIPRLANPSAPVISKPLPTLIILKSVKPLINPISGKQIPFKSPIASISLSGPVKETRGRKEAVYEDGSQSTRHRTEEKIWDELKEKHGEAAAQTIINNLYSRHCKTFNPAETAHFYQSCNINSYTAEKMQHEFWQHRIQSPFSSKSKIQAERKKMREGVEWETRNINMKPTANEEEKEVPVITAKNIQNLIRKRMNNICRNKKFRQILFEGKQELWFAITCDKGGKTTKLGIQFGNTKKKINAANNITMIGLYEGDDSQANLYAAFTEIAKQLRELQTLEFIGEDGKEKTLPIRYFVLGDYKFLKSIAGIKAGNCKYPCVCCLATTKENYLEVDRTRLHPSRQAKCVNNNLSQALLPLFDFVPFKQYIPPSLHITMGPCANLFDELFERALILDASDQTELLDFIKNNQNYRKEVKKQCKALDDLNKEVNETRNLELLYANLFLNPDEEDEEFECCSLGEKCIAYKMKKNLPSNDTILCEKCENFYHPCCSNAEESCPLCLKLNPTKSGGTSKLKEEHNTVKEYIQNLNEMIGVASLELQKASQKFKPGKLTTALEKTLENFGGTRRAFFQAYTGAHLLKMGKNIDQIIEELPNEIKTDVKCIYICQAIRLFFEAKRSMKKDFMSAAEIQQLDVNINNFTEYMKSNLGEMKPKQKGHIFLFHVVSFAKLFKTSRFFTEQAIESYHALQNKYDRRIKLRKTTKKLTMMMDWNVELNYDFDNIDCDDFNV